jgi:hypothetical protein
VNIASGSIRIGAALIDIWLYRDFGTTAAGPYLGCGKYSPSDFSCKAKIVQIQSLIQEKLDIV